VSPLFGIRRESICDPYAIRPKTAREPCTNHMQTTTESSGIDWKRCEGRLSCD